MTARKHPSASASQKQIQEILARLDVLESHHRHPAATTETPHVEAIECCGIPVVPDRPLEAGISPDRENLIRSIEKKWVNGTELRYHFLEKPAWGGPDAEMQIVRDAFAEWKSVGIGLKFREVDRADNADVRIGFKRGDGAWSYIGRDIWNQPITDRTMNFGWPLRGQDGRDTALHEIGHTLGFHHSQQNPFAGIEWDEPAVIRYFSGPPNYWSEAKIRHNVLRKLSPSEVEGSAWDPDSIMQYAIRPGLILRPEHFRNGIDPAPGLSAQDKKTVKFFYPEIAAPTAELQNFELKVLELAPAEQIDFAIRPKATGRYHIHTFGDSDAILVLFEDNNGELEHLAADDDSGWNRNAQLEVRLSADRNYVLRLRHYASRSNGQTALLYWKG